MRLSDAWTYSVALMAVTTGLMSTQPALSKEKIGRYACPIGESECIDTPIIHPRSVNSCEPGKFEVCMNTLMVQLNMNLRERNAVDGSAIANKREKMQIERIEIAESGEEVITASSSAARAL